MNGMLIDTVNNISRISARIADIGSDSMPRLVQDLQPKLDSIFPKEEYKVEITGTSLVALEGYNYLVRGLLWSVLMAFLLISAIMTFLFRSWRMLLVSITPNVIPLILTAGLMNIMGIDLKPSTVLIFGVAFGISVDFAIHFLAKYKQELVRCNWSIEEAVSASIKETGFSMLYTAIILFSGFFIFTFSGFAGTKNLGLLTSITLAVAVFTNLILLPSMLIAFRKSFAKQFKKKIIKTEENA